MKRVGEIKARREHAFWKNRSELLIFGIQWQILISRTSGWLRVEPNYFLTARNWPSDLQSNWCNPWNHYQSSQPRRRYGKKSLFLRNAVPSSGQKVELWVWMSISFMLCFSHAICFTCNATLLPNLHGISTSIRLYTLVNRPSQIYSTVGSIVITYAYTWLHHPYVLPDPECFEVRGEFL